MKMAGIGLPEFAIIVSTVMFVYLAFVILGYISAYIALTHSIKKRIVWGQDFSSLDVFLWMLGWFLLASIWGIPTFIYFLVKRSDINATKAQCAQILRSRHGNNSY